jgi:hypothetical protein
MCCSGGVTWNINHQGLCVASHVWCSWWWRRWRRSAAAHVLPLETGLHQKQQCAGQTLTHISINVIQYLFHYKSSTPLPFVSIPCQKRCVLNQSCIKRWDVLLTKWCIWWLKNASGRGIFWYCAVRQEARGQEAAAAGGGGGVDPLSGDLASSTASTTSNHRLQV